MSKRKSLPWGMYYCKKCKRYHSVHSWAGQGHFQYMGKSKTRPEVVEYVKMRM